MLLHAVLIVAYAASGYAESVTLWDAVDPVYPSANPPLFGIASPIGPIDALAAIGTAADGSETTYTWHDDSEMITVVAGAGEWHATVTGAAQAGWFPTISYSASIGCATISGGRARCDLDELLGPLFPTDSEYATRSQPLTRETSAWEGDATAQAISLAEPTGNTSPTGVSPAPVKPKSGSSSSTVLVVVGAGLLVGVGIYIWRWKLRGDRAKIILPLHGEDAGYTPLPVDDDTRS